MKAFQRSRLIGFFVAGLGAIAGLVWIAEASREEERPLDRHTGKLLSETRPETQPVETRIRRSGSAAAARELLIEVAKQPLAPSYTIDYLDLLNSELADPVDLSDDDQPPPLSDGHVALLEWYDQRGPLSSGDAALVELFRSKAARWAAPISLEEVERRAAEFAPEDRLAASVIESWGDASDVPADIAVALSRRFQSAQRARARLRWLRRAVRANPDDMETVVLLARAQVEYGLQRLAARLLAAARAVGRYSEEGLTLEADLHRWSGDRNAELDVLEALLAVDDGADARDRLTVLASATGDEARAIRHALAAAEIDPSPRRMEKTADLVARMGRPQAALDLYERLAGISPDARAIWMKIGRLSVDAYRPDRAIEAFRRARAIERDAEVDRELEVLYRRLGQTAELVELLLERPPEERTAATEQELLGLAWSLGRRDVAADLTRRQVQRTDTLDALFWNFPAFHLVAPDATEERLLELLAKEEPEGPDADPVIWNLRRLIGDPETTDRVTAALADSRGAAWLERAQSEGVVVAVADDGTATTRQLSDLELMENALAAALDRPNDVLLWRRVAETAGWAGRDGVELRARRRLYELGVTERANVEALANLMETTGNAAEAVPLWERMAAEEGAGSLAEFRLIDALYVAGRDEEAEALLARRADGPNVSRETLHTLAAAFVQRQAVDRALDIYRRLVEEDDTDVLANRRTGEILSWSHDPGGAVPYLERAVELTERQDAELLHLLAEALWSINDVDRAQDVAEESLPLLRDLDPLLPLHESMIARTLARLGEGDESTAIYERLIGLDPTNQDLRLDHVVSLVILLQPDDAREVLDQARPHGPESRRFLRLHGQLLIDEDEPERALAAFGRYLELYGDDAGVQADIGRAHVLADEPHAAVVAFDRALELQPENVDVARLRRRAFDRSADVVVEAEFGGRDVSKDSSYSSLIEASVPLIRDSLRLSAALRNGRYEGRAVAFKGGRESVDESVTQLSLSLSHQLARRVLWGGGIDLYSGGRERREIGGWAGLRVQEMAPFRVLELRAWRNELFDDPAAAVGLGGTEDGFSIERFSGFGERDEWWWLARAEWKRLEIDVRREVRRDREIEGELSLGHWFQIGEHVIQDGLRARRPEPLRAGARVTGEEDAQEQPAIAGWVAWAPSRLRDDHELVDELPMGSRFDYFTANLLVADELASGWTGQVQPYIGYELHSREVQGGVGLRLAYRPEDEVEFRLGVDWGRAMGRAETSDATSFFLAVTLRW